MSDYVSRAKVIEEINKYHMTSGVSNQGTWNECVDVIAHTISEFPSADVRENIHGEWLRMSDLPEDKDDRYKCSNCGTVVHYSNGVNLYHFNSWCGRCGSLNNSLIAGYDNIGKAESEDT